MEIFASGIPVALEMNGTVLDCELQVHETADVESECDLPGDLEDLCELGLGEGEGRQDHRRVSGVDSCVLDVLHDSSDEHIGSVTEEVDIQLDRL